MAPKYRTGLEWEQHLIRPACKAAGSRMSFVEAVHEDPSRLHFPPQSTLNPHRVTYLPFLYETSNTACLTAR